MEKMAAAMNDQVKEDGTTKEPQQDNKPCGAAANEKADQEKDPVRTEGMGTADSRGRGLPKDLRDKYSKNPYVIAINNVGDITYHHEFYVEMYGYIHYGDKTYVEAYETLGFKTSELGENRALSAGKRAVKMAEDGTLYRVSPGKYNGTIPFDKMDLQGMDQAEQIGQLTARVIYLEEVNRTQKKTFFSQGTAR